MRPFLVVAAGLALAPAVAAAEPTVLVLQLEARGVPATARAALEAAVREEVAAIVEPKSKLLPRPALDLAALREATGCGAELSRCLGDIGRMASATTVVRVALEGLPAKLSASVDVLELARSQPRTVRAELVDVTEDSGAELRVHVAAAFGVKREMPPGAVELTVESSVGRLEGAELFVDGVAVKSPELARLAPGRRTLEVRSQGFEPFSWTGLVRAGRSTKVAVRFIPAQPSADPTPPIGVAAAPAPSEPAHAAAASLVEAPAPAGDNIGYLVPGLIGTAALATGVIATIQAVRVLGLQSEHNELCDRADRPEGCGNMASPGDDCTLAICEDGRSAATLANVFWITSGVLAAGAITSYLVVSAMEDTELSVAPGLGGATFTLQY